jgi:hypothetical protein
VFMDHVEFVMLHCMMAFSSHSFFCLDISFGTSADNGDGRSFQSEIKSGPFVLKTNSAQVALLRILLGSVTRVRWSKNTPETRSR